MTYRRVLFHFDGMPLESEVNTLAPGAKAADVWAVDYNDDLTQCRVSVEVHDSTSGEDAILRASGCLKELLPSLAQTEWAEEGIVVLVLDEPRKGTCIYCKQPIEDAWNMGDDCLGWVLTSREKGLDDHCPEAGDWGHHAIKDPDKEQTWCNLNLEAQRS